MTVVERLVGLANSLGGDDEDVIMAGVAKIRRIQIHSSALMREIERLRAENDMLRSLLIDAPTKTERDELFDRRALGPKP